MHQVGFIYNMDGQQNKKMFSRYSNISGDNTSCARFIPISMSVPNRSVSSLTVRIYRGADKSLARPGRKQATATEDFDFHISYL